MEKMNCMLITAIVAFLIAICVFYFMIPVIVCETEEVTVDGKSKEPKEFKCKQTPEGTNILDTMKMMYWTAGIVLVAVALCWLVCTYMMKPAAPRLGCGCGF